MMRPTAGLEGKKSVSFAGKGRNKEKSSPRCSVNRDLQRDHGDPSARKRKGKKDDPFVRRHERESGPFLR